MGSDGLGHAERVRGRRRPEDGGRRCEVQALPGIRSGASFVLRRPQEGSVVSFDGRVGDGRMEFVEEPRGSPKKGQGERKHEKGKIKKRSDIVRPLIVMVVEMKRFELSTPALRRQCSPS